MDMPRLATFADYDEELQRWLGRLQTIDELLERPAKTLVEIVRGGRSTAGFAVPVTLDPADRRKGSFFLRAACTSTIQRLAHRRRRFSWLSNESIRKLGEYAPEPFIELSIQCRHDPLALYRALAQEPLGATSPLTAAEIFWVLIKAGEKHAHGSLGFFCIFNLLWALKDRRDLPERPGPKGCPTAFVAAKCLLPIHLLCQILRKRAKLYRKLAALVRELDVAARGTTQRDRWLVVSSFERLASALYDFSTVASNPKEYSVAAGKVTLLADLFTTEKPNPQQRWTTVRGYIVSLLRESAQINEELLATASALLKGLEPLVLSKPEDAPAEAEDTPERRQLLEAIGLSRDEWLSTSGALASAHWSCNNFLRLLTRGVKIGKRFLCQWPSELPSTDTVERTLLRLAVVNEQVARAIEGAVQENTYSMRRVITREVAAASAGDRTNFDAAELTAALTIVERWLRISDLEVDDALKWSVSGAHTDGSWTSRHPIALASGAAELWPGSSEIVWMVTMAIERKTGLRRADEALYSFVQWLDRTRVDMSRGFTESGWPSEARAEVIDVAATMSAVNALLSIRDLFEERLWELCQKRFVVKTQNKSIFDIDPIDLGVRHDKRLHRRLMRMARETAGEDYEKAEYSLVLHGPPGSSKSALAEAVAGDMFRRRLVRVTPADFIRQGEAGLDTEARFIFSLLSHIRGAMIVFDEVDDLLRKRRPDGRMSFFRLVVPAMLNRLQDLRDAAPHQEICFIFGTNYIDAIEPALTRPGRFDGILPVAYPDAWSRENILLRNMESAEKANPDYALLVDRSQQAALITTTAGWPWSTFNKMCRELTMRPAGTAKDIELQLERHNESSDRPLTYYQRQNRWIERSSALQFEMIHVLFASLSLADAEKQLEGFLEWVGTVKDTHYTIEVRDTFRKQLPNEWRNGYRPDAWQHVPARPRFEVKGSPKPMGVSGDKEITLRVWAPFALQAAVAGDFNAWQSPYREMERMRELPGVWEITLDEETSRRLTQYRYVFTTASGSDAWRMDPCGREWCDERGFRNSVVTRHTKVPSPATIDKRELIGCRVYLDQLGFDNLVAKAGSLRQLGFNLLEIAPACNEGADEVWGLDHRLSSLRATDAQKLRGAVEQIRGAGMHMVLGTAWGFGAVDERHPLAQFDGWSSDGFRNGIYFRADGATLDLDEPQVCNVIFDHAREMIEMLGLRGVHLRFDERIVAAQNLQAASLANYLAEALRADALVWVDAQLDLSRIPNPRPLACKPPLDVLNANGNAFHHVVTVSANVQTRAFEAVAAFTMPAVPVVTYSDDLVQAESEWSKLISALIKMRMDLKVPLASDAFEDLTIESKQHMPTFRRADDGLEVLVVLNTGEYPDARPLAGGEQWDMRLSTDMPVLPQEPVTGAVPVDRRSAKVLYRDTRTAARPQ